MRVRLEKRNGAYAECKFQCGLDFILLLYTSRENPDESYELYLLDSVDDIPADLDDLDSGLMEYAYDIYKEDTHADVFYYECYDTVRVGQWYDVWAEVYNRGDHYDVEVYLRETIKHDV